MLRQAKTKNIARLSLCFVKMKGRLLEDPAYLAIKGNRSVSKKLYNNPFKTFGKKSVPLFPIVEQEVEICEQQGFLSCNNASRKIAKVQVDLHL